MIKQTKERRAVWKVIRKIRKSFIVDRGKYQLNYIKGTIVKSRKETLGIFCFKRKYNAENFNYLRGDRDIIIKVEPIGRGKKVNFISTPGNKNFDLFYQKKNNIMRTIQAPAGSICYPAVKVLE